MKTSGYKKCLLKKFALPAILVLILFDICTAATITAHIKEWELPSSDSFPYDAAVGLNGNLWFTEMKTKKIGRLTPDTGCIKEYPLKNAEKSPDSGPRGLAIDSAGDIWFASAGNNGYIGKLDIHTGTIMEYPLSSAGKDLQDIAIGNNGVVWFTVQRENLLGKLDPQTGRISLLRIPGINAQPSTIAVDSKGVPYFCESGMNKIGRIDPVTMAIAEFTIPEGARPYRLAIASNGTIYYTDRHRGFLGHINPSDGKVNEWVSPGGAKSEPSGIAVGPDGMVWYSESGGTSDTVVRFDPRAQRFVAWKVPTGEGIQNVTVSSQGVVYVVCTESDTIGMIRIEK